MRQRHLNILLIIGIIVCLVISLWPDEKTTPNIQPINYELFEHRFKTVERRVDSIYNQVNFKDTLIHENSIIIHNAPRSKRDSLRLLINPR